MPFTNAQSWDGGSGGPGGGEGGGGGGGGAGGGSGLGGQRPVPQSAPHRMTGPIPSGNDTVPSQSPSTPSYGEPGVGRSASTTRRQRTPSADTRCEKAWALTLPPAQIPPGRESFWVQSVWNIMWSASRVRARRDRERGRQNARVSHRAELGRGGAGGRERDGDSDSDRDRGRDREGRAGEGPSAVL